MSSYLVYKAVAVASCPIFEPHVTTLFAWNSCLLGDPPDYSHPEDVMEYYVNNRSMNIVNMMNGPDLVGISIWRGTVVQVAGFLPKFIGEWSDLTDRDWAYLRIRDLEGLVRLDRFAVE